MEPVWLIVSGAARSGTSMLQQIINTHPHVACLHEYGLDRLKDNIDNFFHVDDIRKPFEAEQNEHISPGEHKDQKDFVDLQTLHAFRHAKAARFNGDAFLIPRRTRHQAEFTRMFFEMLSGKQSLRVFADKTPDLQDRSVFIKLRSSYSRLKTLYIARNPRDVISSAVRRGRQTALGLDTWDVPSTERAIFGWLANWQHLVNEYQTRNPNNLFIKYEDLGSDFENQSARIADFLGIENLFANLFQSVPETLKETILTDADLSLIDEWLGQITKDWGNVSLEQKLQSGLGELTVLNIGERFVAKGGEHIRNVLRSGFCNLEPWGVWTQGNSARIMFRVKDAPSGPLWIEIESLVFFGEQKIFDLIIKPKGTGPILRSIFPQGHPVYTTAFPCTAEDGVVDFELFIERPKGLEDEPRSERRPIGMGIVSVSTRLMTDTLRAEERA